MSATLKNLSRLVSHAKNKGQVRQKSSLVAQEILAIWSKILGIRFVYADGEKTMYSFWSINSCFLKITIMQDITDKQVPIILHPMGWYKMVSM